MSHKIQKATYSKSKKQSSGVKTFKTNTKRFTIDLNKYGGSVETAKDKIKTMFTNTEAKTKIKELVLTPTKEVNMFKVLLIYKIWI